MMIDAKARVVDKRDNVELDKWEKLVLTVMPTIPEPERPKITPARELANSMHFTAGRYTLVETAIRSARAEIIALLEWELEQPWHSRVDCECAFCCRAHSIIKELREADKP
jgi:hypothetical protein